MSSIPIELIAPGSNWRLLNLLKLLRITRLTSLINNARIDDDAKIMARILQLIFWLVIFMHLSACGWYAVIKWNNLWIPPAEFVHAGNYKELHLNTDDHSSIRDYSGFLYNSILFLGGNEIGPVTTTEIAISSWLLVFASCLYAWLFSEMAMLADYFS